MNKHYKKLMITDTSKQREDVRITWLGTAGIFLTDGKTGILIDPYVSRFPLSRIVFQLPLHPDHLLIQNWVEKLGRQSIHAVIASHSHFDHAVDAPFFAIEANAPLLGTESTLNIGRGAGMAESRLIKVNPGTAICFGDFHIQFIESAHSLTFLGRVPYPGDITTPIVPPACARAYKLGGVFSLLIRHPAGTILHHGSAGFKPGMYDDIITDVILLGIAARGDTDQYLKNTASKTQAKLVIPVHLDNFFKPLACGMSLLPAARFGNFCRQAEKYRNNFSVRTLPWCSDVGILPQMPSRLSQSL